MTKKKIKIAVITAAILSYGGMGATAVAQDDLLHGELDASRRRR